MITFSNVAGQFLVLRFISKLSKGKAHDVATRKHIMTTTKDFMFKKNFVVLPTETFRLLFIFFD